MEDYITLKALAKELGLRTPGTLRYRYEAEDIPRPELVHRTLVYRPEDAAKVRQFFATHTLWQRHNTYD